MGIIIDYASLNAENLPLSKPMNEIAINGIDFP